MSVVSASSGSSNSGASGKLDMAFAHTKLWFEQKGSDLVIDVLGTAKQATVQGWFSGSPTGWEQLKTIAASDAVSVTSAAAVNSLVQAMATFGADYQSAHGSAFDPTSSANATIADPAVLAAVNNSWHH
jgi:hypothetical protein